MLYTKTNLIRQLGERVGEHFLSTPSSLGTTTTLIDTSLNQYIPNDISSLNVWVYGAEGVAASNARVERRARTWTASTSTLAFYTAWPTAVTAAGTYEVHTRFKRSQMAEAINSALRLLFENWPMPFVDQTITTASATRRYTFPSGQLFGKVNRIEIEWNTQNATAPYMSADQWGWELRTDITDGEQTTYIQFGLQPPPDRTLRIYGEGYFPDLTYDSDAVNMAGQWAGPALEWIYDWSTYRLMNWTGNKSNVGDVDKYRVKELSALMEARQMVQDHMRPRTGGRIIAPGMGGDARSNWHYMGWFRSAAFT